MANCSYASIEKGPILFQVFTYTAKIVTAFNLKAIGWALMFAFPPHQENTVHKSLLLTGITCTSSVDMSAELKVKNLLVFLYRTQPNCAFECGPPSAAAQRER